MYLEYVTIFILYVSVAGYKLWELLREALCDHHERGLLPQANRKQGRFDFQPHISKRTERLMHVGVL